MAPETFTIAIEKRPYCIVMTILKNFHFTGFFGMDKITSPNNNHAMAPKKKGKRITKCCQSPKDGGLPVPCKTRVIKKVGKRTWRGSTARESSQTKRSHKGVKASQLTREKLSVLPRRLVQHLSARSGLFLPVGPTLGNSHSEYHVGHVCMKYETIGKRWVLDGRSSLHWSHAICKALPKSLSKAHTWLTGLWWTP